MENDLNENISNNYEVNSDTFFELDYEGQSLETNSKFQSWNKKMLNALGEKANLYKCKYDNIYFYSSKEYKRKAQCPLCKEQICYYCSINGYKCCSKGNIYRIIFEDGSYFINSDNNKDYFFIFIRFLLPIYTFCYLSGILSQNLYYLAKRENKKKKRYDYYYDDSNCACTTSMILNAGVALVLSFIFLPHDICFKILLLIFSIFCKMYPLNCYLGIIKNGIDGLC